MQTLYKCPSCGHEFKHKRKPGKKFPQSTNCFECGEKAYRVMGNIDISIAKGKTGHSENGYDRFGAEQPSEYVPLDWVYGQSGRTDEVLDKKRY